MNFPEYQYIDTQSGVDELVNGLQHVATIAIDTEFERTKTYYPCPGLLQISDGKRVFLIDPLVDCDLQKLFMRFSEPDCVLIMHACREDLEVYRRLSDIKVTALFDTQLAAGLLGMESQIGYQALCLALLNEEVDKGETRSNWIARPLSENQKHYAAIDVLHLHPLRALLLQRLEKLGRLEWFAEEIQELEKLIVAPRPEDHYKRIKGSGAMTEQQLHRLYRLSLWRENLAIKKDIPRGFIIKDKELVSLVYACPGNKSELQSVDNIPAHFVRNFSEAVLENLAEDKTAESSIILEMKPQLPKSSKELQKSIKNLVKSKAEMLDIKADILLSNRKITEIMNLAYIKLDEGTSVIDQDVASLLGKWRADLLVQELMPLLKIN